MKILIACEESQTITKEFRKAGHQAFSCDMIKCSGGHPEWHIQGDALNAAYSQQWDLMIAHPPCTYLSVSGAQYWNKRQKEQIKALKFVLQLLNAPINKIALENPVGKISTSIRKPDQYIQPYYFGHKISKKTGLWLKNLPLLRPESIVEPEWIYYKNGGRCSPDHYKNAFSKTRSKERSLTYQGIANAFANQWNF